MQNEYPDDYIDALRYEAALRWPEIEDDMDIVNKVLGLTREEELCGEY